MVSHGGKVELSTLKQAGVTDAPGKRTHKKRWVGRAAPPRPPV
jgi:hypothetical protein